MKKRIYLMILICALLLSGCGMDEEMRHDQRALQIALDANEYGNEFCERVIQAIKEKSDVKLKKLLCNNICNEQEDLDQQIDEFIKVLDGRIVSYDAPRSHSSGSSIDYGIVTELNMEGEIGNIITDKGTVYTIDCGIILLNDEKPNNIGIYYLYIEGAGEKKFIEVDDKFLEY